MTTINAHFDGQYFVPDEPVSMEPGTIVIVSPAANRVDESNQRASADFLRPVLTPPDPVASRRFLDDPATNLENY